MSPRRTRAARRAEAGNSLFSSVTLPEEMSLPGGVMEPVREPMEEPILEPMEEPTLEGTHHTVSDYISDPLRGRKSLREPLGETTANINENMMQEAGRKKSRKGIKRKHMKEHGEDEGSEGLSDSGKENEDRETSDGSGEFMIGTRAEGSGEKEVIIIAAAVAVDADTGIDDLNDLSADHQHIQQSQCLAPAGNQQQSRNTSPMPPARLERDSSNHVNTADTGATITEDKSMVDDDENGIKDNFVQDDTNSEELSQDSHPSLFSSKDLFHERDWSVGAATPVVKSGQEQGDAEQQNDVSFNFGNDLDGNNNATEETAAHLIGRPNSRQGHKRVSEAVQRLEALFEPNSSPDHEEIEMSTIQDILARAPGLEPSESVVEPIDSNLNIGVTDQVKDSTTSTMQISKHHGKQDTSKSKKSAVTRKATSTTRKSSVHASTRVSSQHMTLTPIKSDGVSKAKERSAITALHTPPPVAKSDKPPTKAKFQLPGDMISAKLKLQREERLKKEVEEEQKKRQFKAKPVAKLSNPVEIKTTAASRARMSLASKGSAENTITTKACQSMTGETMRKPSTARIHPSSTGNAHQSKVSTKPTARDLSLAKSISEVKMGDGNAPAPISTAATKEPKIGPSNTTKHIRHRMSVPGPAKNVIKAPITRAPMVARGKDIINRERVEKEEKEKALHAKMDATKKARAEAAERGRIASREWAEKKKAAVDRSVA